MNCKPGDLAVIVRSRAGNEGKIVRCIRLATASEKFYFVSGTYWLVDRELSTVFGRLASIARDDWMRPIRPQDDGAQDESKAYLPPVPTLMEVL